MGIIVMREMQSMGFPMTEDDWTYMMGVLTTMKPKLVKSESSGSEEVEEDEE